MSGSQLTEKQKRDIENKRRAALEIKKLKSTTKTIKRTTASFGNKSTITVDGNKYIDTGGGFLLEAKDDEPEDKALTNEFDPILEEDQPECLECKRQFSASYLLQTFNYPVCDGCRDNEEKHCLITRTEAKNEYLLKDCDLDLREPKLKFILRQNPHNVRWGQMKLYLMRQIEERAIEVWGSMEKLEEAHVSREEKRVQTKSKQYAKKLKMLRMNVRSSLYDRTSGPTHEHVFGEETYNEEDDNYTKECTTCGFKETFEKM